MNERLREKVAYWGYKRQCKAEGMTQEEGHKWEDIPPKVQQLYLDYADEIIQFIEPLIRADERERIVKMLEEHILTDSGYDWQARRGAPVVVIELDPLVWQTLKATEGK